MIFTARRALAGSFLFSSLVACGAPPEPPKLPTPPAPTSASAPVPPAPQEAPKKADPFAIKGPFRPDLELAPASRDVSTVVSQAMRTDGKWKKAIAPAPASCSPYFAAPKKKPTAACDAFAPSKEGANDGAAFLLSSALDETDSVKRDARLAELVACKGLPAEELAALRATLAPPECADGIVAKIVENPAALGPLDKGLSHTLVALWAAGKLARSVGPLPKMSPPFTKDAVLKFTGGPFKEWFTSQGSAIDDLAKIGAGLEGPGRAIVAVEAGLADMRFVERVREVPMPAEWKKDSELSHVYQASLDQAMEPRKLRGRDAALTGLRDASAAGNLQDARVSRARQTLSKLYGGSRIDALDGLLLPPRTSEPPKSPLLALASKLPLAIGERLLRDVPRDDAWTAAVLSRGLPRAARAHEADAKGSLYLGLVRARLELAATYFRGAEADRVLASAEKDPSKLGSPEGRLYLALALALRHAPESATAMMQASSPAAYELRHVEALDALAAEGGPFAAQAAFDAAWLLALSPPESGQVAHFEDVAKRFEAAEAKLSSAADKAKAHERAQAARETANALH